MSTGALRDWLVNGQKSPCSRLFKIVGVEWGGFRKWQCFMQDRSSSNLYYSTSCMIVFDPICTTISTTAVLVLIVIQIFSMYAWFKKRGDEWNESQPRFRGRAAASFRFVVVFPPLFETSIRSHNSKLTKEEKHIVTHRCSLSIEIQ